MRSHIIHFSERSRMCVRFSGMILENHGSRLRGVDRLARDGQPRDPAGGRAAYRGGYRCSPPRKSLTE